MEISLSLVLIIARHEVKLLSAKNDDVWSLCPRFSISWSGFQGGKNAPVNDSKFMMS